MKARFGSLILAAVLLAPVISSRQSGAPHAADPAHARRGVAVTLLRAINTAEVVYKNNQRGMYVAWETLMNSEEFRRTHVLAGLSRFEPELANAQFASGPEILPGWSLRLNVSADGQSYDLLLEDRTDTKCGYGASTDERGVIRQGKTIDCDI